VGLELDDIRSLDDLKLLPILTNDEIRIDHKYFLSEEPRPQYLSLAPVDQLGSRWNFTSANQ